MEVYFLDLSNSYEKLVRGGDFSVIYTGGSITQAGRSDDSDTGFMGYRNHITRWLRENYPLTNIHSRHGAVAGTGSELIALRLEKDVLPYKPDLLFIETAVNDGAVNSDRILQGLEGIVRRIWRELPMCDIVILYAFNAGMRYNYAKGELPNAIYQHEKIARRYHLPSVNMGLDFYQHIVDGKDIRVYMNDDSHPNETGHSVYFEKVKETLTPLLVPGTPKPHNLADPVIHNSLEYTHMVYTADLPHEGWEIIKRQMWAYSLKMVATDKPGSTLSFKFTGTLISLYWHLSLDTGDIEWSIDGGDWVRTPTWDGWVEQASDRINYKVLANNLPLGEHTLVLRVCPDNAWSNNHGTNIRIIAYMYQ